jgi:hypothetical protein
MPRHPRDRWEFPNGPDDHRFATRFDNPDLLGYYQGQERPYSWYDPYYLEEREEFSYRERSPLRRHRNTRTLIIMGVATDRKITLMYTGSAPITIHNPIQRMANFCKTTKKM